MSKFVTYPAVTVLDNDHALLIDSPSAGTNSITAENAADTLLSKWSGFDTFDEAVQNTISNNQEFIDRDTAIRGETADLKRKIVTTFPAKEASGAVATFESEFEDAPLKSCIVQVNPVQDLHGYDHPWPAGGGKNLFQTTAETTTVSGVTFTVNSDGSIKTTGTPTANISTFIFGKQTLPPGEYIANGFANGANSGTRMTVFNENTGAVLAIIYKNNDVTFTLTEESVVRVYPIILTESYESGWTFYPMIRLASVSDATYAPYENICPISGWTGCEVQRTGKNLLPYPYLEKSHTIGGITWTINEDGTVTVNGTASSTQYLWFYGAGAIPIPSWAKALAGKAVTVSAGNGSFAKQGDASMQMIFYGARPLVIHERTATIPSDLSSYTGFSCVLFVSAGTTINTTVMPQIEVGSTPTAYEPYTGQTYPITFPASAGTVYGGYVDVINGELVVDRAMVDLGTLWWAQTTSGGKRAFYTELYDAPRKATFYGICSKYNRKQSAPYKNNTFILYGADNFSRVGIRDDMYSESDRTTFKASLSGTQLMYELAEPIHYPLTPINIKTLLGQNNIWADTGDTAVEYLMSDVSWYVEKKLRAFQSILAGVEDSAVASKNYSTNSYLIFNDDIYRVTKTITAGETIEEGVNVTKTTVAEQLMALAQA